MTSPSRATLELVEAALQPEPPGERPHQIARRVPERSLISVRQALLQLCRAGRASYEGPDCMRLYRAKGRTQ